MKWTRSKLDSGSHCFRVYTNNLDTYDNIATHHAVKDLFSGEVEHFFINELQISQ